jgi:hypothetical protein
MPIDFVGFTADRRITGMIPLADDRLSDMLNSVSRVVLRDAVIADLAADNPPMTVDVTIVVGDLVAVVGTGRRGSEAQRRRTAVRRVTMGLGRYVVSGALHVPPGHEELPRSLDPKAVLAGRDTMIPITDATITYDCAAAPRTEQHETILVNRARALWIEVADDDDEGGLGAEEPEDHTPIRTNYIKDFTNTVAE